jgi:hypothetical protein
MSIENISVSIDPSPLVNLVKTVIREELQPTLYGNDNSLAAVVNDEIDNSPRIHDRILSVVRENMETRLFEDAVKDIVSSGIERLVADNISYSDLADEIDASDVASYIRLNRLAAEINAADIANEISMSEIADQISPSDIASEIDIESLADTVAEQHMADIADKVSDKIDYKKLAAALLDVISERKSAAA